MFCVTRKLTMIAAAAAALGGTTAGAALAATSSPAAAAVRPAPRCDAQDLSASLHGLQVALGYRGGFIRTLTNTGQRSCSLDGYPELGLQGRAHQTMASHTFQGSTWFDRDPGRQLIVLSPGEAASASPGLDQRRAARRRGVRRVPGDPAGRLRPPGDPVVPPRRGDFGLPR
jgi:hypothetical protein